MILPITSSDALPLSYRPVVKALNGKIHLFIAILGDLPIALRRQYKVVLPSQNDGF